MLKQHRESNERPKLYPSPKQILWTDGQYTLDAHTTIVVGDVRSIDVATLLQGLLHERIGIRIHLDTERRTVADSDLFLGLVDDAPKAEGYHLTVSSRTLQLLGNDLAGLVFGIQTLLQLIRREGTGCFSVPCVDVYDWPRFPWRGIHLYLPARESIAGFRRIIRTIAYLKMNTLFIEVGAGMEYERHPEINTAWEEFCREAYAYHGGPQGIQQSQAYWKDSIHPELAGGSYLTKAEVRGIVQYAKSFGMNVVPEIQALSHVYYLCIPHKEIAERPQEPFPDTYCPSNPESFHLYFDVAEEIIEVFEPEWVSIGHDEVRILAECPLCKERTGAELLADEINKLYDFYHAKGIRVMMWGEKLQNFTSYDGMKRGGVFEENHDEQGRYWCVPATHEAIDMIPKDILMLDWYHYLADDTEVQFRQKGFSEIFGNFSGSLFGEWEVRSAREGVLGAEVSTWCLADERTIGRNNLVYEIVFSAGILWSDEALHSTFDDEDLIVIQWLPEIRCMLQDTPNSLATSNVDACRVVYQSAEVTLPVTEVHWPHDTCLSVLFADCLTGIPEAVDELTAEVDAQFHSLVFVHASTVAQEFIASHTFKDLSSYQMGSYEVTYADGCQESIYIQYGIHVGPLDMDWGRTRSDTLPVPEAVEQTGVEDTAGTLSRPPYYRMCEGWRGSLLYFTTPVQMTTRQGTKTAFAFEWRNPHPKKTIRTIRFVNNHDSDPSQHLICVGIAGLLQERG